MVNNIKLLVCNNCNTLQYYHAHNINNSICINCHKPMSIINFIRNPINLESKIKKKYIVVLTVNSDDNINTPEVFLALLKHFGITIGISVNPVLDT